MLEKTGEELKRGMSSKVLITLVGHFTLIYACRIWQGTKKQEVYVSSVFIDKRMGEENSRKTLDAE